MCDRYAALTADPSSAGKSLHERADPRFYWNKTLTQKLVGERSPDRMWDCLNDCIMRQKPCDVDLDGCCGADLICFSTALITLGHSMK